MPRSCNIPFVGAGDSAPHPASVALLELPPSRHSTCSICLMDLLRAGTSLLGLSINLLHSRLLPIALRSEEAVVKSDNSSTITGNSVHSSGSSLISCEKSSKNRVSFGFKLKEGWKCGSTRECGPRDVLRMIPYIRVNFALLYCESGFFRFCSGRHEVLKAI